MDDQPAAGIARRVRSALSRIEVLALFPLLSLLAYWLGGEAALFSASALLPALLAIQAFVQSDPAPRAAPADLDGMTGLPLTPALREALRTALQQRATRGRTTACLMVAIDDFQTVVARLGPARSEDVLRRCAERITASLRGSDTVARVGTDTFGIVLHAVANLRLGDRLAIAERLARVLGDPIVLDGTILHLTVSIGFCGAEQAPDRTPEAILDAAETALAEARHAGPGAVRGYSPEQRARKIQRSSLTAEVADAIATGAIRPWFQPQISTDTGAITGFEALARWQHPVHGLLAPIAFLPAVADAGKMTALGEAILYRALQAITAWDRAGCHVPAVGVNFSADELRDPDLAERLKWEVDRFDLRPSRLTVEILETVASRSDDDIVVRNIRLMGEHGFNLDLDDFGIGQASIQNIRRFRVNRIKIDRSFVTRVDTDPEQRAMVTAILSLAHRLGIDTIAEGVETLGEHAMLAQLGCGHIQGFGLSRPMPFERTIPWMHEHAAKLARTPDLQRKSG